MTPQRFRELQTAAEGKRGAVLNKEELSELLDNTLSLMGEYLHKTKEYEKEKAFLDAETRAQDEAKAHPYRFQRQVFMGSGMLSMMAIGHAHSLISEALTVLGGIQQPPGIHEKPSEEDDEQRHSGEYRVRKIADELFLGLTGKQVMEVADVED